MGNEIWSINNDKYIAKYYFTCKINLLKSWASVVVSGVLCRFKLAFPTVVTARYGSQLYFVSSWKNPLPSELGMPALHLAMDAKWGFEWEENFNLVLKLKIWTIFELRKKNFPRSHGVRFLGYSLGCLVRFRLSSLISIYSFPGVISFRTPQLQRYVERNKLNCTE